MGLRSVIDQDIKKAMLAKEKEKLEVLRAIKAAILLEQSGFDQVVQLDGGILNYINVSFPDSKRIGKCFVFDDRITID